MHTKILDIKGKYLSIDGVAESVNRWIQTKGPLTSLQLLQQKKAKKLKAPLQPPIYLEFALGLPKGKPKNQKTRTLGQSSIQGPRA